MGEVTADAMDVAVYYGVSILILYFSATVLLGGSFGFRRCGVSTLFLMMNFCAVDFPSVCLLWIWGPSLYSEVLFASCSCTAHMFAISYLCDANYLLSFRIALADSSFSPTEPVVWCLIFAASLVKKSLKLLQFLARVGFSFQVSHGRLNNLVSSMARYAERRIFSRWMDLLQLWRIICSIQC